MENSFLEEIKRIKTLADIGLLYAANEYDKERYQELDAIALRLLQRISGSDEALLRQSFPTPKDYPTAKVDVRALVLSPDRKILLVKESSDGCWSLPGGWAEVGFSPAETAAKECKEETGLEVDVKHLLAVFDKRKHPHPPEAFYVFKLLFQCEALTTEITKGFDVLDVGYFAIDHLPPLSQNRILKSQIELGHQKIMTQDFTPYFD